MATLVFSNPVLWGHVSVAPLWSCLFHLTAGVRGLSTDMLHGGMAPCLVKMVLHGYHWTYACPAPREGLGRPGMPHAFGGHRLHGTPREVVQQSVNL